MIPKVIHYCWFGGNDLPELALRCIESWKKFCPDYEIREWNESNFDVNCCDYVREAYESKKWAFVSDYARFKILYENGGLYFDTDVELIKPLDDIIARGGFMGIENEANETSTGKEVAVNPGLGLAVTAGLELYSDLVEAYHNRHFIREDGSLNLKTVVEYTTEILKKKGLANQNEIQYVAGVYIYPKEYFCPMDYETGNLNVTEKTYSIHHFHASWHSESEKYAVELQRRFRRFIPRKMAVLLSVTIAKIKYDGFGSFFKYSYKWMKNKIWQRGKEDA